MKPRNNPLIAIASSFCALVHFCVHAEILSFNGDVANSATTHTINASDWADYVGGSGSFNSANDWGRLFWRGSSGDGQYMHFNLSSLAGLTVVSPATVTLQNGNPTWGGGVDGSYVATANGAWTAGGGQTIPGATAISDADNATGSYGWGAAVSWGIGYGTFQNIVDNPSTYYGLAVIGGAGSKLHFSGPANPYLTVKTGTLTPTTGLILANIGSTAWNASNFNYVAATAYNPAQNTLTVSGELTSGTSGAGTVTINNGGTVAVNQASAANYYQAVDSTTIHTGGKLTINSHSNVSNLTLAGGELASTGTDPTWGSWAINGTTTVTGGVTSTISAQQVTLTSGVFNVGSGSTLHFTGTTRAGSLTKNGAGTMYIPGYQSYMDGTTVNAGTLEVNGQNSGWGWLRGAITINSTGTLKFTGGDGTGFGWNNPISSLTIDGGTFDAAGSAHVGFGAALPLNMSNGATIAGSGQWNGGLITFTSSGDSTNTISGSWNFRGDSGADQTFTVNNGAAATDLLVSANLSNSYTVALVKSGAGTMKLTGNNSFFGQTRINAGTVIAATNSALGAGGWDGNTMTWVYDGATLALEGGVNINEHMHVFGTGVGNNGAIRSLRGNNALTIGYGGGAGPGMSIDSNTTIGVDADTLTATGFYEHAGSWGLTKVGAGTLKFTQESWYTGGTTVNEGTLTLDGGNAGNARVRGALTVNTGATVNFSNDDGTGLGWNGDAKVASLTINGGTVSSAGTMHVWNMSGGVNMTGGTLQSNSGVSDPNGAQLEWINSTVTTNASANTATIGGRIRMRADGGAAGITFNVANGAADSDLLVSAAVTEASAGLGITKNGAGTMVFSGANNYTGNTIVNEGTLSLSNPVLDDVATVIIETNGVMELNFTGSDSIGNLQIGGGTFLPAGTYNSSHPEFGSYFTGTGSLIIEAVSSSWESLTDGDWGDATNWLGNTIATGFDNTATFSKITGANVTINANRIIGNLVFENSDYTLSGSGSIALDAAGMPLISVENGCTATISANLAGNLGLEKTGAGHLVLAGSKSFIGGTTVTSGTLELSGSSGGNSIIRGALQIKPGAGVSLTNGDGTGFGWNNPVTSINIDHGTLDATFGAHIGFGSYATIVLDNGSSLLGNWQWNGNGLLGFSSYGDTTNTISGSLVLRADAGANHTFTVDDGAAETDLQIDANLSDQWPSYQSVPPSGLTKAGTGNLTLSGTNTYDGNTLVDDGSLNITATGSLNFRPTTNGTSNTVSGTETSSLSFLGTVNLDLTAADATDGNIWNLFNINSFITNAPVLTPASITSNLGAFSVASAGVWELIVTDAKWVFTEANGNLAYVSTASDFDTWKIAVGVTGGENDDDDNDGVTNFEEYAFGLNPTDASQANAIAVALDKTTGTFSYTRRTPALTGLDYAVWYSTDLSTWTQDGGATAGTPAVNGEVQTVPMTISPSLLTNDKLFIRVLAD